MTCEICKGKQLLPFKRKDGSIVPNTWVYCSCKRDELDHYREITPDDFDFPVSWDFHRWICATYGKGDPGSEHVNETRTCETEQRLDALETQRISDMPERRTAQMQAKINQLEGRLNEHIAIEIKVTKLKKKAREDSY